MSDRIFNVLFLCTGNTARSVLAESILRKDGAGRFRAFSAGSQPKGVVNPFALKVLEALDYPTDGFRSKSWDEFAVTGAPVMDFEFTVCDSAAGESCPVWPGQPMTAHWGIEDPAAVEGTDIDKERAFNDAARFMRNRISAFLSLPMATIDKLALQGELKKIGTLAGATALTLEPIDGGAPDLKAALEAAKLPTDDLADAGGTFYRIRLRGSTIGFGGYEIHGESALFRSIVVASDLRGRGVGRAAVKLLLNRAFVDGAKGAYLLTETAAPFFERLGFEHIERSSAPEDILATRQATSLCPSSAALLARRLPA
jgi:protein-tyrosine-phosphatase/N-acetylglutamate synthase-like GNAT family acetyltransferase